MSEQNQALGIDQVPLLTRREIEARLAAPLINRMAEVFGQERVWELAAGVIEDLAFQAGQDLARRQGGNTLEHFTGALDLWKQNDALQMEVLESSPNRLSFDVTRCRYAEMYREIGAPELGLILSCRRDFALAQGFNPAIQLVRTQTIMEGAPVCDFRFSI